MGSWVGIEYMAQAIAAHAGYWRGWPARREDRVFAGGAALRAQLPLFVDGSVLQVHVQQALQGENGLGAFECRIEMAGAVLAQATITVFQPRMQSNFAGEYEWSAA